MVMIFLRVVTRLPSFFLSNYARSINYHNTRSPIRAFNNFNPLYRLHAFNLMMIAARWCRGYRLNARVTHVLSLARSCYARSRNRVLRHNACWRQKCQLMLIIDDLHSSRRISTRNYDARCDLTILFCMAISTNGAKKKKTRRNNLSRGKRNIFLALTGNTLANWYRSSVRSRYTNLNKNVIFQMDSRFLELLWLHRFSEKSFT